METNPVSEPLLSILIPTIPARADLLARLMAVLNPQTGSSEVEVLIESDDCQLQIGQKRNLLVARSRGKFISSIDDDDLVEPDYVERIIGAIRDNPEIDCVGIEGRLIVDGRGPFAKPFYHSIAYETWRENKGVYYRAPNHLNPIRRDHVVATPFLPISFGEDRDFSARIYSRLKLEVTLLGVIYHYLYRTTKTEMMP